MSKEADRRALAASVPRDVARLMIIAYAADKRREDEARSDGSAEAYATARQEEIEAWRDVGEAVADWLCSGREPVVPIDDDAVERLAALPAGARAKNLELAESLSDTRRLRVVR